MMISIVQHIEYLMMYHDCVVVPGWGALIANYTSSNLDGNRMQRPQRTIGFNATINHNDGLLANSLMRRHNLRYEQACSIISDNVTTYYRHVKAGNELAFGHLGYFKLAEQQRLEFIPMYSGQSCDEFFGLNNIDIISLTQSSNDVEAVFTPVAISWREKIKVAASIVAILGVGLLLSTPVIIDKTTQTASLNVAEIKTQSSPVMPHQVSVTPVSKAIVTDKGFAVINKTGKETPVQSATPIVEETKQDKNITSEEMPWEGEGKYSLVIKSFKNEKRASYSSRQLTKRGINNLVILHKDRFAIVVAQSDNKKELDKIKKSLRHKYKNAFVCKSSIVK